MPSTHSLVPAITLLLLGACGGAAPPVTAPAPASSASTPPAAAAEATPSPSAAPAATPPAPPPPITPGLVIVGEIIGPPKFDPKPALDATKGDLRRCYDETRALQPTLHGKLTLQLRINEAGAVVGTDAVPGGSANDPGLVGCIADAMKTATFPKPGGTATITVPLVFRR
jgi:hypothetical protein